MISRAHSCDLIRVRLVRPISLNGRVLRVGGVIETQESFAAALVRRGAATFVGDRELVMVSVRATPNGVAWSAYGMRDT